MMRAQYQHIGEGIAERRRILGLSQQELADRAGVARAHLSQVESGNIRIPNVEMRRKMARALGVRHTDLLMWGGILSQEDLRDDPPPIVPARLAPLLDAATGLDDEAMAMLVQLARRLGDDSHEGNPGS